MGFGKLLCGLIHYVQCLSLSAILPPSKKMFLFSRHGCVFITGAIFDLLAFLSLLITGLFMGFKAMNADPNVRVFYYINAYVCGVATFGYFAMLSGMGWETIMGCRQFFYVR